MFSIMTDVLCLLDVFRKIPGIPERGITLENAFHARYLYDQKEEVITPEDEQAFAEVVAEVEAEVEVSTAKVEEEEKESEKEKEAEEDGKKDCEEPSIDQTPTEKEGDEQQQQQQDSNAEPVKEE